MRLAGAALTAFPFSLLPAATMNLPRRLQRRPTDVCEFLWGQTPWRRCLQCVGEVVVARDVLERLRRAWIDLCISLVQAAQQFGMNRV